MLAGYLLSPNSSADLVLGNPVAANGWSARHASVIRFAGRAADRVLRHPSHLTNSDPRKRGLATGAAKIVTWLILPVVICLSQRLSHACLSISNYTVKLRMAH